MSEVKIQPVIDVEWSYAGAGDFHISELKIKMIYSGDFVDSFIYIKGLILMDYTLLYQSQHKIWYNYTEIHLAFWQYLQEINSQWD